jgi:transmembrane sensor
MSAPEELSRIDGEAAEWFVRRDAGLDTAQAREFERWLAADPRHAERFARHERTWVSFAVLENDTAATFAPEPRRGLGWGARLAACAAVAAVLVLGLASWRIARAPTVDERDYAAAVYENRILEDGSILELRGGSRVRVRFGRDERAVTLLQGEAHFHVARDAARPFVVRAGDTVARAVGTAFNVRLGADAVEVLVTEGVVRVAPAGPAAAGSRDLAVRQRSFLPLVESSRAPAVVDTLSAAQVEQALAWKPTVLEFSGAPLGAVLTAFNARNTIQVTVADEHLARRPMELMFRSADVDAFVRLLEHSFDLRAERDGHGNVRLYERR